MDLIVLVLPLVVASGVFLVFASFLVGQQLDPVQARLQQISVRPRTLEELELQRPIAERTLKPIVQGLAGVIPRFYSPNTGQPAQVPQNAAARETPTVELF